MLRVAYRVDEARSFVRTILAEVVGEHLSP
jgi:hypothetical protein